MKSIVLPEETLNELAQKVSDQMLSKHDFAEGVIRGEELKGFSDHEQINKFLLFQVFQVWNLQLSKLKHPYFDFDQPEIQQSIQNLRNQLSRHIRIDKDDFAGMVKRAVFNNLKLLLDPSETFASFFFVNGGKTSLDLYQRYVPFFSDLDFVVNSIQKYAVKNGMDAIEKDLFFEKMNRVFSLYDQKSGESIEAYRDKILTKLTGSSLSDIEEMGQKANEKIEAEKAAAAAAKEAEEAARAKEAEEKAKAEEEARRQAEEAEAKRKADEEARLKAEEEARKKEEEKQRVSFFDTLAGDSSFFEIDEEASETVVEQEATAEEADAQPLAEVKEEEPVAEVEEAAEEVAETTEESSPAEEAMENIAEKAAEVADKPVSILDRLTANAQPSEEFELADEPVAEAPAEKTEEPQEEIVSEEKDEFLEMAASMEPVKEQLPPEKTSPGTILDNLKAKGEESANKIGDAVEEKGKTILDKVGPVKTEESNESTASFLDRFLSERSKENNGSPEPENQPEPPKDEVEEVVEDTPVAKKADEAPKSTPVPEEASEKNSKWEVVEEEKPASVLEKLTENTSTIAERFGTKTNTENGSSSANGNRKIKLDEIPIHKQYQYVQKVFEGNNVRFRIIVDKVNNSQNKAEIEDILQKFVLGNGTLDQSDQVVQEFIELLRNRY